MLEKREAGRDLRAAGEPSAPPTSSTSALEPELKTRRYIVLDLRSVQSVDITAAHMLEQIEDLLAEREAYLLFSGLPRNVPSGRDMQQYFDEVGLARTYYDARVLANWTRRSSGSRIASCKEAKLSRTLEQALKLHEMDLFTGRKAETLAELSWMANVRSRRAKRSLARGETGDELFLIRRGAVRIWCRR